MEQYSELELNSTSHFALTGRHLGSEHGSQDYSGMLTLAGARIVNEAWLLEVVRAAEQVEWLQRVNTLHRQVDILYVVDGYEVTVSWDDNPISEAFHGATVAEAIDKAMSGFDLDARHSYQDRDIYGHERQLAVLTAQRDELLAALVTASDVLGNVQGDINPERGYADELEGEVSSAFGTARNAIAKAKGGAQ